MEKILRGIRILLITTGTSILIIFAEAGSNPLNSTNAINNNVSHSILTPPAGTASICGEVIHVYDTYGYCLTIQAKEDNCLYDVTVPDSDKAKKFEPGDLVTVSYSGESLDSNPGVLLGVTSVKRE